MKVGTSAKMVKVENDQIVALASGAGYCAEHEMGSNRLQAAMNLHGSWSKAQEAYVRRASLKGVSKWLDRLINGPVAPVDVLSSKMINNLKNVAFLKYTDPAVKVERAFLVMSESLASWNNASRLNSLLPLSLAVDEYQYIAAWDDTSACFSMSGEKGVALLEAFYKELCAKNVAFAGFYLAGYNVSGVIVAKIDWMYATQLDKINQVQETKTISLLEKLKA